MSIKIGDRAPAFTLFSFDRKEKSLEDYEGKNILLLFFPLAFSGVCTEEMCSIRNDMANYDELGADIIAISVDTPMTLGQFKSEMGLSFTLLSDFNKEVSRAYGCLYEEFILGMKGVSKRAAFVIDKKGDVKYAEVLESAEDLPNFEAVKATLGNLN